MRSGGIPDEDHRRWRSLHHGWDTDAPWPDATETENPVTHTLLGPRGETLRTWRERSTVPFGFQRREHCR